MKPGEIIPSEGPDLVLNPGLETKSLSVSNTGDRPMKFLCMVPNSATGKQVTVAPECGTE